MKSEYSMFVVAIVAIVAIVSIIMLSAPREYFGQAIKVVPQGGSVSVAPVSDNTGSASGSAGSSASSDSAGSGSVAASSGKSNKQPSDTVDCLSNNADMHSQGFAKGFIYINDQKVYVEDTDTCDNDNPNIVYKYSCQNIDGENIVVSQAIQCDNGCSNGACV